MTTVNANVRGELARLADEKAAGIREGFAANVNQLPAFYFDKPIVKLTARERGYMIGREFRLEEMEGADLDSFWPSLEDEPCGNDIFAGVYPVSGEPSEPVDDKRATC